MDYNIQNRNFNHKLERTFTIYDTVILIEIHG